MSRFEEIMETVFKWEGGWFDHPHDNGGPTNMGITHKVLAKWRGVSSVTKKEVRNLKKAEAIDIFKERYWKRVRGDKLPPPIDLVVMDGAVNHGVANMVKFLQDAVGRTETGRITNADLEKLAEHAGSNDSLLQLVVGLAEKRKARYVNHEDARHFLRGWSNRLNDVMGVALNNTAHSWTMGTGLTPSNGAAGDGGNSKPTDPDPVSTLARPVIEDEDLQAALKAANAYKGEIDGLFGPGSVAAMRRVLQQKSSDISGNWKRWSTSRLKMALGQLICEDLDIEIGRIDGLYGPQTEHAFLAFNKKKHGLPEDTWLDEIVDLDIPDASPGSPSTAWPRQSHSSLTGFYGPHGIKGGRSPSMKRLSLPFEMKIAWDQSVKIDGFSIHELLYDSAARVFDKVLAHYGESGIEEIGVDLFGGCYNPRKMRGSNRWSTHAWAIAIDFDPARNKLKWSHRSARLAKDDAKKFWEFWEAEGWTSLGRARDFDWMHIQAARL